MSLFELWLYWIKKHLKVEIKGNQVIIGTNLNYSKYLELGNKKGAD